MNNAADILDQGFACLVENLGVVDAEHFIALIKGDKFDYTVWQREYFDQMEQGQIRKEALEYAQNHPHKGRGEKL